LPWAIALALVVFGYVLTVGFRSKFVKVGGSFWMFFSDVFKNMFLNGFEKVDFLRGTAQGYRLAVA